DNDLRDVLEWEVGYTVQASQKRKGWMHPDLYNASILAGAGIGSFSCASEGLCMLTLPGRNESEAFLPDFRDNLSEDFRGLICKTTQNFRGCQAAPANQEPFLVSTSDMTATLCQELCRGQSKTHAAVSVASCYCVDAPSGWFNSSALTDTTACSSRCPGHRNQFCGGQNMALWYSLEKSLEGQTAHSCDDIYNNGIFYNSTYVINAGNDTYKLQVCSITCDSLTCCTNANLSTEVSTYRTQVTLSCPYGQEFADGTTDMTLECRYKGWNAQPQSCQDTQCQPLHIDNAVVSSPDTIHGSNVTVTCNQGYTMATDRQSSLYSVTCEVNEWTPAPSPCERKRCSWTDQNLHITAAPDASLSFEYGTTLPLVCNKGYAFPNGSTVAYVYCTDTAVWSPPLEPCVAFCADIEESSVMGYVTVPTTGSDWEIAVTCYDGYAINNSVSSSTHVCVEGSGWLPPVTSCARKRCSWTDENLHITAAPDASLSFEYGTTLPLVCNQGYAFPNGSTVAYVYCTDTAVWSPPIEPCVEFCTNIDESSVMGVITQSTTESDWEIVVTCYDGYAINNSVTSSTHVCDDFNAAYTPLVLLHTTRYFADFCL
ncbi:hypothetical protein RRG08_039145, partial [Elysia crispata]